MNKITTINMELILVHHFKPRTKLIVPNVSWGLGIHECDLLILSQTGYATEIEIKVSAYDLVKDKKKRHKHDSHKIKYLYFAIPHYLEELIGEIPERAGVIIVRPSNYNGKLFCDIVRKPKVHGHYKFSEEERYKLARLGALRIWTLKQNIQKLKKEK